MSALPQLWPMPARVRPVTIVGAGGVVTGGHLPAYRKWGFPVAGLFDRDRARAGAAAAAFGVPRVHASLDDAIAAAEVLDLALPPQALAEVLPRVPPDLPLLIQKPLGRDLAEARRLASLLDGRPAPAAVNFQLRTTPAMVALDAALAEGRLGEVLDIEVHLVTATPWGDWPFLADLPAVELAVHSIHYLDWIRATLGMPRRAYARAVPHPDHPRLADARSSIILDYGDRARVLLSLDHTHRWGPRHQAGSLRVEGTRGAAVVGLGYNLDPPVPETLELAGPAGWEAVPLQGARIPDGFGAMMAHLQRVASGEETRLLTGIGEALATMRLVQACIEASRSGEATDPEALT